MAYEVLLETVGESIAEIVFRHPGLANDRIDELAPAALRGYKEMLKSPSKL